MKVELLLETLQQRLGVDFYVGVPDSQLKALCDTLNEKFVAGKRHIIAANEGAAVGLAAGHYIATGNPAMVYMQNSGLGNAVNPIASLLHEKVYAIPCVFMVGWRGEPGISDEPQHIFQGEITLETLSLLQIQSFVLTKETSDTELVQYIEESSEMIRHGKSVAFVVKKGALQSQASTSYSNDYVLKREDALKTILQAAGDNDIFVATTGKSSRELFEIRESLGCGHSQDFLTVGSMGHASMIAMGIALERKERRVWCIDGDGAALMHFGSVIIAANTPCDNFVHIVMNNNAHESVGGAPVAYGMLNFLDLAKAAGYGVCIKARNERELKEAVEKATRNKEKIFIEVMVAIGSRDDLGRPTTTPKQNKDALMQILQRGELDI